MYTTVTKVHKNSPASKTVISAGDTLRKINGHIINDVLDYCYYSYDSRLVIEFTTNRGTIKLISVSKPEGEDLGLEFEAPLMDKEQSCRNKCIFCFIDQLPEGMRTTLYHKDDDVRQSLLDGNYVTLTNLDTTDIKRLIKFKISPINVSVHTMNPKLKQLMLGRQFKANSDNNPIKHLRLLARAGIMLNCQIVCCPGINDGNELEETIINLIKLGPSLNSVSVVPVGLTRHREGLYELKTYKTASAREVIALVEHYGDICLIKRGRRIFYCSDEFYMTARFAIPPNRFYEGYPQLQNGVGMMRLFILEFLKALKPTICSITHTNNHKIRSSEPAFSVVTGTLAEPYIKKLINITADKCDNINVREYLSGCKVYAIKNYYFGETVTVSGLITGADIINQLKNKNLGKKLLIPQNMLRHNEDLFLDDVTVKQLSEELHTPVIVVGINGAEFLRALLEVSDG